MLLRPLSSSAVEKIVCQLEKALDGLPEDLSFQTRLQVHEISPELLYRGSALIGAFFRREVRRAGGVSFDLQARVFLRKEIQKKLVERLVTRLDTSVQTAEVMLQWCMDIALYRPLFFQGLLAEYDLRNQRIYFHNILPRYRFEIRWMIDVPMVQLFLNIIK